MKFNFLQGDFSGGELSPRAQGHADSDAYKAGLSRAANVVPTRTGSIASRAGLEAVLEGMDAGTGLPSNLPVQHVDVHDGPYGDFVVEVSPTGIRLVDRSGVLPWNMPPTSELVQFTVQDGAFAYGDARTRTVHLRSDLATGLRSYYLTRGSGPQNALLPALSYINVPPGTSNQWILSGKVAGDIVFVYVVQSNPANFQTLSIAPDANGNFSITFRPNIGGTDQDFYIRLATALATTATNIWDIKLTKNNVKTTHDTTGAVLSLPSGDTTPLVAPAFGGVGAALTPERVRAAAFWALEDFWVAFAGGQGNRYAGFALRWHSTAADKAAAAKAVADALALLVTYSSLIVFTTDAADFATYTAAASAANAAALVNDSAGVATDVLNAAVAVSLAATAWGSGAGRTTADAAVRILSDASADVTNTAAAVTASPTTGWTFGTLPCTANSLAKIVGANAVAVFQDRLWYGINLVNGKRVVRASAVGYGRAWGYAAQANSTGAVKLNAHDWLFQFTVETETFRTPAFGVAGPFFTYNFPADNAKASLLVTVNGERRLESHDYLLPGHYFDYQAGEDGDPTNGNGHQMDQTKSPGGVVAFRNVAGPPYPLTAGTSGGDLVVITRVALADDPLDLSLASPAGKVAWLNVLRGLVLGTTRNEKLFQRGVLAIDPATGLSFDIDDESSYGSDPALPALDINDKVLFVQQGRKVLRYAGLSITTNGGLVSEDVGVMGEHLTAARVRSLCFLKSPVPRVVMAFDDGTGAVMSILVNRQVAFSRLTLPACFGGIYSVAALNTNEDSELWVGAENGVTLRAASFESDITSKELVVPGGAPWAPAHAKYDTETPLPPVMDGWQRLPLVYVGGVAYVAGLPACMVGQSVWALINGQVYGPHVVAAGGKVVLTDVDPDLNTTWVDASGARRVQEVYVGLLFTEHRFTTLPLEGGNPVGSSQSLTSRKPQLYVRLVDSYLPLVNGTRLLERGADDDTDELGERVTADRRATEEGYQRGGVVDVVMDLPLRMEISAVHGGVVMNNI